MPLWHVNGTSLYFEVYGRGTPLIFIHGFGLTHEMFGPQIEFFKGLCKIVLVDLRGNGQSGKLLVPNESIIETQCEDLSKLLAYLGIKRAVLVGVSYGGVLAQKFSQLFPDQVSAIIISDSFSKNVKTTIPGKMLYAITAVGWLSYYLPGEFFIRSLKIMYYRWDLAYRAIRKGMLEKRSRELHKQRIAVSRIDYTHFLPQIEVPVLCIVGANTLTGVRHMKATAKLLANVRFEVIEDSYDPSNLCQPQRFNESVQHFLEENHLIETNGLIQRYS